LLLLICNGQAPLTDPDFEPAHLQSDSAHRVSELVEITKPGPLEPRTLEMGMCLGAWEGSHLIAMGGERMHAGRYREISCVCTQPDYQGRGWAGKILNLLIAR
jgi:ribosomal protein S18 acetylase RimI-like enzyme